MNLLQSNNRIIPGIIIKIFLILVLFNSLNLYSQQISSPIQPEQLRTQKEIGAFIGLGSNSQSGTMLVDCPECRFEGGAKFGYTLGLFYEFDLFSNFMLGASISFEDRAFQSLFGEYENVNIVRQSNKYTETVPVLFNHTADVSINTFSITPYLKYNVFKFLYLQAGFSSSFVIKKNVTHTKEAGQSTVRLSNGEVLSVSDIDVNGKGEVVEDGKIPDVSNPVFYLPLTLGFNIPLGINTTLFPAFQYDIALNDFSKRGENFKVNSWYFILGLKVAINNRDL
jgi:hypothetical protein